MISLLNNPVWEALKSKNAHFNEGNDEIKYYPKNVSPFIGLANWDKNDLDKLQQHISSNRTYSVMIAKQINLPNTLEIIFSIPLYQMYCPHLLPVENNDTLIRKLSVTDIPQMLSLTEKTKPGPFYERTIELGNYMGIFDQHELIAMAGERLQMNGFTELSAVCTSPNHLGKGYASYLSYKVAETIIANGNKPFLHVRTDNQRAIELYKKLGFEIRADVYFAVFKKL
jgi:predicted GNAT family acetyltransferase